MRPQLIGLKRKKRVRTKDSKVAGLVDKILGVYRFMLKRMKERTVDAGWLKTKEKVFLTLSLNLKSR